MNIFILSESECPIESALQQCDVHIRSQAKESAQLLSNCFSIERLSASDCPGTQKGHPRKHSYPHHPCSKWTAKTKANMDWLILHAYTQFEEFSFRYKKRHFSQDFLDWIIDNIDDSIVPDGDLTEFAVAIQQDKKCRQLPNFDSFSVSERYRQYYICDKPFAKWEKGRSKPDWF